MTKIKHIIIGILSVIIILLGGDYAINNLGGGRQDIAVFKCQTATTSPTYLITSTASSSCVMNIASYDNQMEEWMLKASTTATTLNYCRYVSNENVDANRDWYLIGCESWTPANSTASSTYQTDFITNLNAKYMKYEYKLTGDAGAVYLETAGKEGF